MKVHRVEDLDRPDLTPYRTLRRPQEHFQQGIFVAEGEKVVRRLLGSDLPVVSMLLTPNWFEHLVEKHSWNQEPPEIYIAEKSLLEKIVGFRLHQGIMAVARVPEELSWKEWFLHRPHPFLMVALDGVVSAENVGLIVRNCGAFGAQGILVGPNSSSPFLRRAVRNSMGAIFSIPVFHVSNLNENLNDMKQTASIRIVAAHPSGSDSIYHSDLRGDVCVVFGNEGWGISAGILDLCDIRISIPMENKTDSLNVAAASAVFLYEARRQNR